MDQIKLSHFVHCTTECIYTECGRKERKKIWRRRRRHHLDWDLHRAKMCVFSLYTEIGWQRNDISVAKMNEEKFKFFSCSLLCFHNMYSLPFFIAFHCLHFHGYQVTRIYRFIVSLCDTHTVLLQQLWTTIDQIQMSVEQQQQQTTMTVTTKMEKNRCESWSIKSIK